MAKGLPDSKKYIKEKRAPLRFGADGKFRILHLTDIHEVDPEMDDEEDRQIPINKSKETINVIRRCIEIANPDLVVFGGDNISGYWQEFTYEYMYNTIPAPAPPRRPATAASTSGLSNPGFMMHMLPANATHTPAI